MVSSVPKKFQILNNALRCGLRVRLDAETPGYGNCWYYAIVQQMRRPEISCLIDVNIRYLNHYALRRKVSDYVETIHSTCPAILNYKNLYIANHPTLTWEKYMREQSSNGSYADEIFIMATAVLIGLDIHITSEECTLLNPL